MAVKSITLDLEAYERLKGAKRGNESFSDAVKRLVPKPFDYDAFLKRMRENTLGDEFADHVEKAIAQRRSRPSPRRRDGLP